MERTCGCIHNFHNFPANFPPLVWEAIKASDKRVNFPSPLDLLGFPSEGRLETVLSWLCRFLKTESADNVSPSPRQASHHSRPNRCTDRTASPLNSISWINSCKFVKKFSVFSSFWSFKNFSSVLNKSESERVALKLKNIKNLAHKEFTILNFLTFLTF